MNRKRFLSATAALVALVVQTITGSGAQASSGPSAVTEVTATAGPSSIAVAGTATFVDVPVVVAVDPSGDAVPQGLGTDLTKATISRPDPTKSELHFSLDLADPVPQVFAIPEAIHYSFFFAVGPDAATQWLLLGLRTSQSQAPGSTNPVLNLHQFRADATCCDPRPPNLAGSMTGNKVTWILPMSKIGATTGTSIEPHPVGTRLIQVQIGASGAQRLNSGQPDMMPMDVTYTTPGAAVKLGIAPAGTPEEAVALTTAGTVNAATGAFSGTLPKPVSGGSYIVVAEACYAPGNCGRASTTLTV